MAIDPSLFINRELSWLEFNSRVLHEAKDPRNPLLERLKFLSIFSTNLDEFYMVRVAGLRRQIAANVHHVAPDGMTPSQILAAISRRVAELMDEQRHCLYDLLIPELAKHDIRLVKMGDLSPSEWQVADRFFQTQVFPVLTPLAVDPGHPFPYVSNLSLSLAVQIFDPTTGEQKRFARLKVPKSLPRWVTFGRPGHYVPLEDVIGANLGALFPGMEIRGYSAFRVTRYSDLEIAYADDDDDLMTIIETIRERDILVHHPFESFPASVEPMQTSAAVDASVLAIKMTLGGTTGDTTSVRARAEAAQPGQQVAVLIELQGRLDEVTNI